MLVAYSLHENMEKINSTARHQQCISRIYVSIEPKNMKSLVGGPLLVGAWGPGPLGPLKSGPVYGVSV